MAEKKTVIVVGGGFAGLQFVRRLDQRQFDIILIDRLNHHQFQPLFYQVATSQLEPSSISFPLRHIFRKQKNVKIRLAEVKSVDVDAHTLYTSIGPYSYDLLVLAIGCSTHFFGKEEIRRNAFSLKTTYEAITIRNHILQTFEDIITAEGPEREALLNIVVVGGGPTGVELAGAFAEIKRTILPRDYHRIDFSALKIILVEGSPRTLNSMSATAGEASLRYLRSMGVEVRTETFVQDYDGEYLKLSSGETLRTRTVIWAAGVTGNTIDGIPPEWKGPGNRLKVDRFSQVLGTTNIYALGDIAYMETPRYPRGHPQVANVAINQARNLARNLNRALRGSKPKPYEYRDLGTMATLGRNKAVVDLPFVKFTGFFAWITWMFLHLMLILSTRNKLIIFINWAWAYITKDTALRLILRDHRQA
jgi:NADH dehydrogenase